MEISSQDIAEEFVRANDVRCKCVWQILDTSKLLMSDGYFFTYFYNSYLII